MASLQQLKPNFYRLNTCVHRAIFLLAMERTWNWKWLSGGRTSTRCLIYLFPEGKCSKWVFRVKQGGEGEGLSSKQLFQHHTVAFPCRWLIQVRRAGRGEIRLWALSVNHTALPHRRHLSPNTKGFSPGGTLKPISALTRNPSRPTKSSIVERHHIHFLCKREREGGAREREEGGGGEEGEEAKRQRTVRRKGI